MASLPALTPDLTRLPLSLKEFKSEISDILTEDDKRLIDLLFYKFDNANLLKYLHKGSTDGFDEERAVFTAAEIRETCSTLKSEGRKAQNIDVPDYMAAYIKEHYARFDSEVKPAQLPEDRLSALYYGEVCRCSNAFLAEWFEFNLNICNVLTALNCRKYGFDANEYIVGDNDLAQQLRRSASRDLNLPGSMSELLNIAEEQDLMQRERRLDAMRLNHIEEQTFYKTFDIEAVIAYCLRLEILERRLSLDKAAGEHVFRSLVNDMKRESSDALQQFQS